MSVISVLSFDPASNNTGAALLAFDGKTIDIKWTATLCAPTDQWSADQKIAYLSHVMSILVVIERPNYVISEQPWGRGASKEVLSQLMGAIKAHLVDSVKWQVVSQARKILGHGAMDKEESAKSLLKQNLTKHAKKMIKKLIAKNSYDELDAIVHGVAFIVKEFITEE